MAKVLLVDTNISSSPIHKFLVSIGHDVTVIGGNPQDFLAKTVAKYIQADYSNPEILAEVVARNAYDFVVPGCNDRSYFACAQLNSDGRYPGLDTLACTETINNKQLFRDFAQRNGLPVPGVYSSDSCPENRSLIVKPVDAFSGRGVTILHFPDADSLVHAQTFARSMSGSQTCIIEDFVGGQLYSHSCFLDEGGKVFLDFIVEEHGTANPFVVDTSRVVFDFPEAILDRLRSCAQTMARSLGIGRGLLHTQFILQGDEFWLIEVTRRCPGDLYSQLIELATGTPYAELYARPFIDLSYPSLRKEQRPSWIMRHTMSLPMSGTLGCIQFNCSLLLERMYPMALAGDALRESPFGRLSLIFVRASSATDLNDLFACTLNRELYSVEF
ncbi:acetyl-CoA carboxylase biotin carboxylase subunit family protein [Dechloromonas sp. HYN0024]|uniref:ATP-grasp domain-containing protein n=1 Tax=Dechloromonas sp. HYN0024 TaxID=2231055 RepID=UPI000E452054|nr:ATP-grasp domain-containing protein [Dechloromonas sp. HYN0024]AXS80367.1 ATP-grasp domain-containing protein [Dechloromonas sp. HYN0024]